ncbi:hypothetical protein R1flu_001713 [Riccia fluitans]|uniref:FAD-binding FR-type domain-containing protein n=1 Tax=Riccia fluitans TaxID=41844 RepID=A0ABD1Y414_9MARC
MAALFTKIALLLILWGLFLFWWIEWLIYPTSAGTDYKAQAIEDTRSDFLDLNGPYYLMWTLPVFLFAIVALVYLEIRQRYPEGQRRTSELPKWRQLLAKISSALFTQPILVGTPMGILTAIDLLVIALVGFTFLWIFCYPLLPALDLVDATKMKPGIDRWMIKVGRVGTWTGRGWYLLMALLFFPISRGSPILRLVNVPFEHAVRYHRWLGHFSLWILLTHSITFSLHIYYTGGRTTESIWQWKRFGVSNLAGVLSMLAGIVLWVTSLELVRKRFFDVFYITHHMYLLVFAFGCWHVGDFSSFYFLGCVMLFFIDRFLRAVQSRKPVSVLSAQVLPSGLIKLKFPMSPSLTYSALGMIYINVPSVSKFQWHPFSTTSSSLEKQDEMSICIKPQGGWTKNLLKSLTDTETKTKSAGCPLKIFAEGPYSPETDYFLRYKTLVLVAGGVGITPFMAIIRDLLCRYQKGQESIPENVELIWCVPRKTDLGTLRDISPEEIYPEVTTSKLKICVRCFVTRENAGNSNWKENPNKAPAEGGLPLGSEEIVFTGADDQPRKEVTHIGESNLWIAAVIAASTTGFIIMHGIFHIAVVRPNNHSSAPFFFEHGAAHSADAGPQGKPFPTAVTVTLLFVSMFLGVVVFGGAVVLAWMLSKRSLSKTEVAFITSPKKTNSAVAGDLEGNQLSLLDQASIVGGSRPSIAGLFEVVGEKYSGEEELCVLVCGPESLQESVADVCRSRNFKYCNTQFQFYSTSFDL